MKRMSEKKPIDKTGVVQKDNIPHKTQDPSEPILTLAERNERKAFNKSFPGNNFMIKRKQLLGEK